MCFIFSSRRRHTRYWRDWSSDVCSSDLFDSEYLRNNQNQKTYCNHLAFQRRQVERNMEINAKPPRGQFINLCAIRLFIDIPGVILNGSFRNEKAVGNILFACAPREQFRNFGFTFGKFYRFIHQLIPQTSLIPYFAKTSSIAFASEILGSTSPFIRLRKAALV